MELRSVSGENFNDTGCKPMGHIIKGELYIIKLQCKISLLHGAIINLKL